MERKRRDVVCSVGHEDDIRTDLERTTRPNVLLFFYFLVLELTCFSLTALYLIPPLTIPLPLRYNKAKAVHSVLRHVADMEGKSLEALYQTVGWPLYKKYGHAYDAFKLALK